MKSANNLPLPVLQRRVKYSALATRASLLSLMALIALWLLWLLPPGQANPITILLIHLLPLSLFIPAVLRGQPRPHAWLCFVILIYFCEGVIYAGANHPRMQLLGSLQAALSMLVFSSAMLFARWRSQLNSRSQDAM